MKKKGFTLVELLVVIAIIAMLLAILMPALGKVRQLAYRLMCGTNLKGLGTAMMVYSNDYDESYPVSGGKSYGSRVWTDRLDQSGGTKFSWKSLDSDIVWTGTVNVTVSSSWFLLIKYSDVSAAQFVCQASDQKKFEFPDAATIGNAKITDITMLQDFGKSEVADNPYNHVSYCMQNPFFGYSLSASGSAAKPIAADRNPWISSAVADEGKFLAEASGAGTAGVTTAPQLLKGASNSTGDCWANSNADNKKGASSQAHQAEGENVLFNDGHVSFEKTVLCGVESDNIYTTWTASTSTADADKQQGKAPTAGARGISLTSSTTTPYSDARLSKVENDSFLTL